MRYKIRACSDPNWITPIECHGQQMRYKEIAAKLNAGERLREACQELLDAPHYEHFAVRLNDEEMKAFQKIEAALAGRKPEGRDDRPEVIEYRNLAGDTESQNLLLKDANTKLEQEVERWKNLHAQCLDDLKKSGRESDALAAELRRVRDTFLCLHEMPVPAPPQNLTGAPTFEEIADRITSTLKDHALESDG